MTDAMQAWRDLFAELRPDTEMRLSDVFADTVVFEDPLHHVEGIDALDAYFRRLNAQLHVCRFEYGSSLRDGARAATPWTMHLSLARAPEDVIEVPGVSMLELSEGGHRVARQRDHFDVGAMVYERVPLLGGLVRAIKKRI